MAYKTLEKLFYADPSSDRYACHDELLRERLTADGTVRTGIHLEHGELFACVPLNLSVASERILRKERKISNLWNSLPYVALGASIRSLVLEEVVFSNSPLATSKAPQWDKSDFTPWRNGGQTLGVFICLITDVHSSPSRLSPATVILHTSGLADTFSKYPAAIRLDNDLLAVGFVTSR
jgi:hypothetical protein